MPSILRLGSAAFCDTSIAVALCYYLQKRRTGYRRFVFTSFLSVEILLLLLFAFRTDQIIDKLIAIAVHTGLITR